MKKIFISTLFFTILSCGVATKKMSNNKVLYEVLTQQADGGGNIHFFEILSEPQEIKMLQNDERLKRKLGPDDLRNANFVILNMGEKPSGGYAINIESVVETENNIIVTVKETAPEPGGMTTQNITYPFCVLKINSKKPIIIK